MPPGYHRDKNREIPHISIILIVVLAIGVIASLYSAYKSNEDALKAGNERFISTRVKLNGKFYRHIKDTKTNQEFLDNGDEFVELK